jgi:hypothetical protein
MKHEKTFAAIEKLKDVELELHRLKNALEMANRALDAQPAQEPVGKFAKFTDGVWREVTSGSAGIPLYTDTPQPAQEPDGFIKFKATADKLFGWVVGLGGYEDALRDLYGSAAPPQRPWVGLTDEEVSDIIDDVIGFNSCWGPEEAFAKAIEAKLKEKNTP